MLAALAGVAARVRARRTHTLVLGSLAVILLLVAPAEPWKVVLGAVLGMIAVWALFRLALGVPAERVISGCSQSPAMQVHGRWPVPRHLLGFFVALSWESLFYCSSGACREPLSACCRGLRATGRRDSAAAAHLRPRSPPTATSCWRRLRRHVRRLDGVTAILVALPARLPPSCRTCLDSFEWRVGRAGRLWSMCWGRRRHRLRSRPDAGRPPLARVMVAIGPSVEIMLGLLLALESSCAAGVEGGSAADPPP